MTVTGDASSTRNGCADLHTHTNASDGLDTPASLIAKAVDLGLSTMALTDHDTIAGIAPAAEAAAGTGLTLIPGIELSTEGGGDDLHILGYFIDPTDERLLRKLTWLVEMRVERARKMAQNMTDIGRTLELQEILDYAGGGTVGRPHVARAMIDRGYVGTVGEAFKRFLGRGKPGYAEIIKLTPEKGISLIQSAGGVAVLAHPLTAGNLDDVLPRLKADGLVGMEVWYGEYDDHSRSMLARYAQDYDLIATGGSDYHGLKIKPSRPLGRPCVPLSSVDQLRKAAGLSV